MRLIYTWLLVVMFVSACTGADTKKASNPYGLAVGDRVELVTKKSARYEFEVTEITDSAVIGRSVNIPFDDIQSVVTTVERDAPPSSFEQVSVGILGFAVLLMMLATPFI